MHSDSNRRHHSDHQRQSYSRRSSICGGKEGNKRLLENWRGRWSLTHPETETGARTSVGKLHDTGDGSGSPSSGSDEMPPNERCPVIRVLVGDAVMIVCCYYLWTCYKYQLLLVSMAVRIRALSPLFWAGGR